jgi:hypothetical protein
MKTARGRVVALVSILIAMTAAGCSGAPTTEPESDYTEVKPLIYDYGLVYDCVAEAITEEGFQVASGDRDRGVIESNAVEGVEDRVKGIQPGQRVRARVVKKGAKDFVVRLAATKVERTTTPNEIGPWRYVGRDEALLERLMKRFDQQVEKRYKPAPDKG